MCYINFVVSCISSQYSILRGEINFTANLIAHIESNLLILLKFREMFFSYQFLKVSPKSCHHQKDFCFHFNFKGHFSMTLIEFLYYLFLLISKCFVNMSFSHMVFKL